MRWVGALLTIVIMTICGGSPAGAATSIVDTFDGVTLISSLEAEPANTYAFSGVAHNTSDGTRAYIRTVDADYSAFDFTYQLTVSIPTAGGGSAIAFVGIGDGIPDVSFFGEPLHGVYLRMSPNDWYGGSFNLTIKNGESIDEHSSDVDLGILGSGTHRVRLTKTGNTLTFAVDANSRAGPFVADFSTSKSISADLAFLVGKSERARDPPFRSRMTIANGVEATRWRRRRKSDSRHLSHLDIQNRSGERGREARRGEPEESLFHRRTAGTYANSGMGGSAAQPARTSEPIQRGAPMNTIDTVVTPDSPAPTPRRRAAAAERAHTDERTRTHDRGGRPPRRPWAIPSAVLVGLVVRENSSRLEVRVPRYHAEIGVFLGAPGFADYGVQVPYVGTE